MRKQTVPVLPGTKHCPMCGSAVRVASQAGGYATARQFIPIDVEREPSVLASVDSETSDRLREDRKGKKTVALVGMASTSCSLAPFEEPGVEIWGVNEEHAFPWFKGATAWFQLHKFFLPKRNVYNHEDWLKEEHGFPIYMQFVNDKYPNSVEYALEQIKKRVFGNIHKGKDLFASFTSTFAYQMALALYQGFERIEIYGFDMSAADEFAPQKACAEFWIGYALGMGVEIYLPPDCQLLWGPLYAYQGFGHVNIVLENNIG